MPLVCPSSVRSLLPHLAFALIVDFNTTVVLATGIFAQILFVSEFAAVGQGRVPDVIADEDSDRKVMEAKDRDVFSRREVFAFFKDTIVRKVQFSIGEEYLSINCH